jgi:hypothetical protein
MVGRLLVIVMAPHHLGRQFVDRLGAHRALCGGKAIKSSRLTSRSGTEAREPPQKAQSPRLGRARTMESHP